MMKHKTVHLFVFSAVLAALVALASFVARPGLGQSQSKDQSPAQVKDQTPTGADASTALQPTAAVRERRAAASATTGTSAGETLAALLDSRGMFAFSVLIKNSRDSAARVRPSQSSARPTGGASLAESGARGRAV